MKNLDAVLKTYISEQIAIEEQLVKVIEQQISEVNESDFADAKDLLIQTREVLERHFVPLNKMLDQIEHDAVPILQKISGSTNGVAILSPAEKNRVNRRISQFLRDDYSALNFITMSNTLLHTTALALGCEEIAETALRHLRNLAPLVVKIGELVPEVVTRELRTESPNIDLSVAQIALKNARLAWRNV